ncbi:MAG: PA3496 family putative envelope integrity protein [Methylosarcina sp.]|jgi:hypothetical protein
MTKEASPSVPNNSSAEPEVEKSKHESDIDIEDFDLNLIDEYTAFPTEHEEAVKKMAARRKIEMYWEKKRLKEQLGDFEDFDFDF